MNILSRIGAYLFVASCLVFMWGLMIIGGLALFCAGDSIPLTHAEHSVFVWTFILTLWGMIVGLILSNLRHRQD